MALVVGLVVIIGGIGFDIGATIYHSPDLSRESNPGVRYLLDGGHGLTFVYMYGFLFQGTATAILVLLWWGYLRNYQHYLACAFVHRPASYASFIKACGGGGRLTWPQHLFAVKRKEAVARYQSFWSIVPIILFNVLDRWYWGLKWFELVPELGMPQRIAGCIVVGFAALLAWLYLEYRRSGRSNSPIQNTGQRT